jgi:hypothetical protein
MKRGGVREGAGRPKGVTTAKAVKIRNHYESLLHKNLANIQEDLDTLEPKDRLLVLIQLSKFAIPQLRAVDMDVQSKSAIIDMTKWK